jgi:myo-inositol-1(or 4)-monophosphatase
MLLVKEAGGMVTDFSAKPYHPGDREMLASNGRIHSEMQAVAADISERAARQPI